MYQNIINQRNNPQLWSDKRLKYNELFNMAAQSGQWNNLL